MITTTELDNLNKPYKIFAEVLDQKALEQFINTMKLDCVVQGALMPDAHCGYTLPIGAVVAVKDVVFPSFVGYDIGCGMCAIKTNHDINEIKKHAQDIFKKIYENIPVGFSHNSKPTKWNYKHIPQTNVMKEIFNNGGLQQIGTLGGGNHFIEIGQDENQKCWIIIHSGSRGIGHATATHYMKLASGDGKAREGFFGLNVNSQQGKDYIIDLNFCLQLALENRMEIMRRIFNVINKFVKGDALWDTLINRNHNHAEKKHDLWIHRKGATHAEEGMMGVIPGNMRDGSFIVKGKGNPDALYSSSHGAGRILGRKEAKRTIDLDDFSETMSGIIAKVSENTLDESPFAYKSIFDVMKQQEQLVEVIAHVKPILNVKG